MQYCTHSRFLLGKGIPDGLSRFDDAQNRRLAPRIQYAVGEVPCSMLMGSLTGASCLRSVDIDLGIAPRARAYSPYCLLYPRIVPRIAFQVPATATGIVILHGRAGAAGIADGAPCRRCWVSRVSANDDGGGVHVHLLRLELGNQLCHTSGIVRSLPRNRAEIRYVAIQRQPARTTAAASSAVVQRRGRVSWQQSASLLLGHPRRHGVHAGVQLARFAE